MNTSILTTISDLRTRIERLEALEIPAQTSEASYALYLAVTGGDYGILRIDADGTQTLLNAGLPTDCSVVNIAAAPDNTNRIALLVNQPAYPYPLFAIQDGIVIRGDPNTGYPTDGGTCLYIAEDGATFTAVDLPTSNGDSAGRVCMAINNVEWNENELVIVGAVDYLFSGVVAANTVIWRWSSGSAAVAQFETTGTVSIPFLTIPGQDGDVVSLELFDPFGDADQRIAYADDSDTNWNVQYTGAANTIYTGADLLPDSRTLIAGINSSNIVLLSDYRIAGTPTTISTVPIRPTILVNIFDLALANWLSAATHGVYYIDTLAHLQKITDPSGTPSTAQVAADQIPDDAVISFVRAARQNRASVVATDEGASLAYVSLDGSTWTSTEITAYTITGVAEIVDVTTGEGTYPSPHALSGDRHFGPLSSTQHSTQPGGTLHAGATTSTAGFLSGADKTLINNLGTTYAPIGATYIVQTPSTALTNEQALSLLSDGYVKVTTATGVLSSVAAIPAADLTGIVPIANGGTGAATTSDHFVFIGPISGGPAAPSFRALVASDIPTLNYLSSVIIDHTDIASVISMSVLSGPNSIEYAFALEAQTANTVWAGATSGGIAFPIFRSLVAADIPSLAASKITSGQLAPSNGGTGANNTGNLAWPSGGGTAALLGASQTFTGANVFNGAVTGNNTINLSGTGTSSVGGWFGVRVSSATSAALDVPWITGDSTTTATFGALDSSNNRTAILAQTGSTTAIRAVCVSSTPFEARVDGSATNTAPIVVTARQRTSGTPAAGFGVAYAMQANSTTTIDRSLATVTGSWVDATDASRKARVVFGVFDTATRECLRLEASGTAPMAGFLGAAAVVRQVVTGSRGGNAALASGLTALANLGLITDSTTA